jgi:hypothetical protein
MTIMALVVYLQEVGEWLPAAIGLGVVFAVAAGGATGLGWWVMRADSLNRRIQNLDSPEHSSQALHEEQSHSH